MDEIRGLVAFLLRGLIFAIFVRAMLRPWIPNGSGNPFIHALDSVTEPVLAPLRRILPNFRMIDVASVVALIMLIGITKIIQ